MDYSVQSPWSSLSCYHAGTRRQDPCYHLSAQLLLPRFTNQHTILLQHIDFTPSSCMLNGFPTFLRLYKVISQHINSPENVAKRDKLLGNKQGLQCYVSHSLAVNTVQAIFCTRAQETM